MGRAEADGDYHAGRDQDANEKRLLSRSVIGSRYGLDNRSDPSSIGPEVRVVTLIGITGSGKSATGNTMMTRDKPGYMIKGTSDSPRHNAPFASRGAVTSVTRSVSFRDYTYQGVPYRIIDTPGLHDTNRSDQEIAEELMEFRRLAPHGVSCFLIVLPMGRMTEEHEAAVKDATELFGPKFLKHSAVVVTRGTDGRQLRTRESFLEDLNHLPLDNFLRRLVRAVDLRVVCVENILQPARHASQFLLNQIVLDTVKKNDGTVFDWTGLPEPVRREQAAGAVQTNKNQSVGNGGCVHSVRTRNGRLLVTVECDLGPAPGR